MIARFAHHNAIQWNISEEYDIPPFPFETEQVKKFARYINSVDPYRHPVTVHNWDPDGFFEPFLGDTTFSLTSLQFYAGIKQAFPRSQLQFLGFGDKSETLRALGKRSDTVYLYFLTNLTRQIQNDDMSYMSKGWPFLERPEFLRKAVTWPVFLSGGAGIEFIAEKCLELNDFRLYERTWKYTWNARNFVESYLPFREMEPCDGLITSETSGYYEDGQVLAKTGEVYAIYFPDGSQTGSLNLQKEKEEDKFMMRWYNPRTGKFEEEDQDGTGRKEYYNW